MSTAQKPYAAYIAFHDFFADQLQTRRSRAIDRATYFWPKTYLYQKSPAKAEITNGHRNLSAMYIARITRSVFCIYIGKDFHDRLDEW